MLAIRHFLLAVVVALIGTSAANAEIAIVVHPDSPIANMTAEQIKAIYLGNDSRFRPTDLPDSEPLHHWFYYKVTGRDALQIRILRARQIARGAPPKVVSNSVEAVRRVAANKHAIAYVDVRSVDASVKVIMTIDNPAMLDSLKAHE